MKLLFSNNYLKIYFEKISDQKKNFKIFTTGHKKNIKSYITHVRKKLEITVSAKIFIFTIVVMF